MKLRTILDQIKIWESLIQAQDEGFLGQHKPANTDDTPITTAQHRWLRPPLPPPGVPVVTKHTKPGQSTTVTVTWRHHPHYITIEPSATQVAVSESRSRAHSTSKALLKAAIQKKSSRLPPNIVAHTPASKMNVDSGSIRKFLIYYQQIFPENNSKYTVMDHWKLGAVADANCTSASISTLLPSAKYTFAVCARNSYGKGHIGGKSEEIELPQLHMLPLSNEVGEEFKDNDDDDTDLNGDGSWRMQITSGKQLIWTMALMNEGRQKMKPKKGRIRRQKQIKHVDMVGKFVISVAKEKYVETGKGDRVKLHPQLEKRRLVVSKRHNYCCKLDYFDHKPLQIEQTFRFQRRFNHVMARTPEADSEGESEMLEEAFHEMKTDETVSGESETAEADAMRQSKVGKKRKTKDERPWYQLDVYLHTERKWNGQTSAVKLEAVAACRQDEPLFRCSCNKWLGICVVFILQYGFVTLVFGIQLTSRLVNHFIEQHHSREPVITIFPCAAQSEATRCRHENEIAKLTRDPRQA